VAPKPSLLRLNLALVGIALVASACGSSSTLAPSTVGTITGITLTVNPPGVGTSSSALATVSLSTGTTVPVLSGFASDTPSVATITTAGVMTGVSIGDVTISIDYQGFKASKKVRVLPNYGGTFLGTYTFDACTDTGGYTGGNSCASILPTYPLGTTFQIGLSNTQSADLTSMTGQFLLGQLLGNSAGTVSSTGDLTYTGSIVSSSTWRMDFQNFTGGSPSVGHIGGHFQAVWTDTASPGSSVWSCTIVDLVRQ
jgi:hypothetical protein